jgi:hypothetical protein
VEVVHAEQLQLDGPTTRRRGGFLGARTETKQRNEKSGRESGRSREQVPTVGESHGRKVGRICRGFVSESWTLREPGVKRYLRRMRVIDCDCGQTLQAANDEDLFREARSHVDQEHPDMQLSDDQVRELVSAKAYEASDS